MSRLPIQVLAILVFALTLFFIWDFSQRVVTNIHLAQAEQDLEGRVAQADATRAALIAEKTRVASPDYAEQIARSKWHWARDGETLVVTQVTPVAPTPVPSAPSSTPKPEIPWWQQLFDFLFGP
jgi:cell division protein FtsB